MQEAELRHLAELDDAGGAGVRGTPGTTGLVQARRELAVAREQHAGRIREMEAELDTLRARVQAACGDEPGPGAADIAAFVSQESLPAAAQAARPRSSFNSSPVRCRITAGSVGSSPCKPAGSEASTPCKTPRGPGAGGARPRPSARKLAAGRGPSPQATLEELGQELEQALEECDR